MVCCHLDLSRELVVMSWSRDGRTFLNIAHCTHSLFFKKGLSDVTTTGPWNILEACAHGTNSLCSKPGWGQAWRASVRYIRAATNNSSAPLWLHRQYISLFCFKFIMPNYFHILLSHGILFTAKSHCCDVKGSWPKTCVFVNTSSFVKLILTCEGYFLPPRRDIQITVYFII